jgi:hypothetical protein
MLDMDILDRGTVAHRNKERRGCYAPPLHRYLIIRMRRPRCRAMLLLPLIQRPELAVFMPF